MRGRPPTDMTPNMKPAFAPGCAQPLGLHESTHGWVIGQAEKPFPLLVAHMKVGSVGRQHFQHVEITTSTEVTFEVIKTEGLSPSSLVEKKRRGGSSLAVVMIPQGESKRCPSTAAFRGRFVAVTRAIHARPLANQIAHDLEISLFSSLT